MGGALEKFGIVWHLDCIYYRGLTGSTGAVGRLERKKAIMAKALTKTKSVDQYREILEDKAREVRRRMSTPVAAEIVARREEPNDTGDLAGQSHEEWIFLNQNAQNASLLRQVVEALERIQDGSYGTCAECDKPISPKRMEAVPWAKYCIGCQEKRGSWTN